MPDSLSAAQKRLNRARAAQRRAVLGPPLDAALDAAATVSAADMPETVAFARSLAGQRAVDLLEAG